MNDKTIEIERRFLVNDTSAFLGKQGLHAFIDQSYLSVDPVVRVRITSLIPSGVAEAFITVKGPKFSDASCREFEYKIPLRDAEAMTYMCDRRIKKFRYVVDAGNGLKWEVDRFVGTHEGLFIAEIELPSEDTKFWIPDWLGEEITSKHVYSNSNLAKGKVDG